MPENHETKRLKVWHVLLAILILLLLTWLVYYMRARANFDAACEKIRAAGYPAHFQALEEGVRDYVRNDLMK